MVAALGLDQGGWPSRRLADCETTLLMKIIQIAATTTDEKCETVYALTEDGRVWYYEFKGPTRTRIWVEVPPIQEAPTTP